MQKVAWKSGRKARVAVAKGALNTSFLFFPHNISLSLFCASILGTGHGILLFLYVARPQRSVICRYWVAASKKKYFSGRKGMKFAKGRNAEGIDIRNILILPLQL